MKSKFALICQYAAIQQGDSAGGGGMSAVGIITRIKTSTLPITIPLHVATCLEVEQEDVGRPVSIGIRLLAPTGTVIVELPDSPPVPVGQPNVELNICAGLAPAVVLPEPGTYRLEIRANDVLLETVTFEVETA